MTENDRLIGSDASQCPGCAGLTVEHNERCRQTRLTARLLDDDEIEEMEHAAKP